MTKHRRVALFAVAVFALCTALVSRPAIPAASIVQLMPTPSPSPSPIRTPAPTPRPTPTPKPTPEPLEVRAARAERKADACGSAECRRSHLEPIFREAWKASKASEDHAVRKVIPCESQPDWERTSLGSAGERGLLQLHPVHRARWQRMGYSDADMFHVVPNARVGQSIYDESGWSPWTCG